LKKNLVILGIVFVLANIADLALTRTALSLGAVEANPIMALFIGGPLWSVILLKVVEPILISYLLIRRRKVASLSIVARGNMRLERVHNRSNLKKGGERTWRK